jgi:hypothetical protein
MILSQKTIEIFKYFSNLSPTILVRQGNILRARSVGKTILTKAVLDETFPEEFVIYSIPEFLKTINLFKEPNVEFNETHMLISESGFKVRYLYTPMELYPDPPKNEDFTPSDVNWGMSMELCESDLVNIKKASTVLNLNTVSFTQEGIVAYSDKDKDANNFKMDYPSDVTYTGNYPDDFEINFMTESLDVYSGKYKLDFSCGRRSSIKMTNEVDNLSIWIASNPSSRV